MSINLETELDDARTEREAIRNEGTEVANKILVLLGNYATKHGCKTTSVRDSIADLMTDLIFDATGPVSRRIVRLEDEIGALEERDLNRNSPIVL